MKPERRGAEISFSLLDSEPAIGEAELGEHLTLLVDDGELRTVEVFAPELLDPPEEP